MHDSEGAGWGRHSVVRLSIPQGQRRMFAGNEPYSRYVMSACHLVLPRALPRLNTAVVDSPKLYFPLAQWQPASLQVFPPGRGRESPGLCVLWPLARAHSAGLVRRVSAQYVVSSRVP